MGIPSSNPVAIISVWLGNSLPPLFPLWLKSVAANPDFDFLLLGDCRPDLPLPPNVTFHPITLPQIKERACKASGLQVSLSSPYKICDFRPLFGIMFEDMLQGYDFWGHCDLDMIFGKLNLFISHDRRHQFDKLYPNGHLSLYRNTPFVNERWKLPYAKFDVMTVLTSPANFAFDEWDGIYNIYRRCNFPFFCQVDFAEPLSFGKRFRLLPQRSNAKYERRPRDYAEQLFYWQDGRCLRAYVDMDGQVQTDEFVYIHFQKWAFPDLDLPRIIDADAFYCLKSGFIPKQERGIPDRKTIRTLNPPRPQWLERLEYWWRRKKRHLKRKMTGTSTFASKKLKIDGNSFVK